MHRLFVAIRPPAEIRRALTALMGGVAGARWQDDDQLHLTLRFIGEVDHHRAEDIAAALGGLHASAVTARIAERWLTEAAESESFAAEVLQTIFVGTMSGLDRHSVQ